MLQTPLRTVAPAAQRPGQRSAKTVLSTSETFGSPGETSGARAIPLFGLWIDPLTLGRAVRRIRIWVDEWHLSRRPMGACRVVVTPNVDHVVRLHQEDRAELWEAYRSADMTLADGMPIVAAANLLGRAIPERVPGSDLAPALFAAATAERPLRVFLLGAAPGVADTAATRIAGQSPHVDVVGTCCPPLGFQDDPGQCENIVRAVAAAQPDVLIVGLGFPKQELWVHRHRDRLGCAAALCVGATIDFLAGNRARAPRLVGALGLEWAFRMASEPRRLAGRYLNDLACFPGLLLAEARGGLAVAPPRAAWTMPVAPAERPAAPAMVPTEAVLNAAVETASDMPSRIDPTETPGAAGAASASS